MSVQSSFLWICFLLSGSAGIAQQHPEFVMQRSHHKEIRAAAFSPDGRMILSGGVDGVAILWDVVSGRVIRQFNVSGNIECIAFPSATRALFGVQGAMRAGAAPLKAIQVWDVAQGRELTEVGPYSQGAMRIALTADGRYAATSAFSGYRIWDTKLDRVITSLDDSTDLAEMAFSSDGSQILIGGAGAEVKLWDTKAAQPVGHYGPIPNQLFALTLSPDGNRAIIGWNTKKFAYSMSGSPAVISVWDAVTGKERARFALGDTLVGSVALSPDGTRILASLTDGTFRLLSTSSGTELWNIGSFPHTLNKAIFSPDGTKILTLAMEHLTLRDASNGKALQEYQGSSSETSSVVFTSGESLITGNRDNTASVWDLKTGRV
jgi:WD40 repeat protein